MTTLVEFKPGSLLVILDAGSKNLYDLDQKVGAVVKVRRLASLTHRDLIFVLGAYGSFTTLVMTRGLLGYVNNGDVTEVLR